MKANSEKTKQSKKATRRVLAGVLCGVSVLSLVLSLVMPPISQAIANDDQTGFTEEAVADNSTGKDAENRKVTTLRVAREKTLLRRIRLPMAREPRALRSPRMMAPMVRMMSCRPLRTALPS